MAEEPQANTTQSARADHPDAPTRMHRRGFLQAGLLGVAATVTGACAPGLHGASLPPGGHPGTSPDDPVIDPTAVEDTWNEPWVWRPSEWPGQQLPLSVVENQNPGPVVGFGNPNPVLFSYGGNTPGPTIRMRGDEILKVKLRNLLGQDDGTTPVGPNPDPNELTPELDAAVKAAGGDIYAVIPADVRDDFCLGEHVNGLHAAHVTNLHTHGLHVRPYKNPDGTHSDNVILRVMPQQDLRRREQEATSASCVFLRNPEQTNFLQDDEQAGEADYEFRIGNVQRRKIETEGKPPQPHPPGTHWYHPHAHGATHNQVSSGMAGFLIVEGDVDEQLNLALTGQRHPDPSLKTGPYDYRERLMLVQRVFVPPADPDAPTQSLKKDKTPKLLVNGNLNPAVLTMRPGAVERWRVLNGSVDGRGFKRVMVLKGQFCLDANEKLGRLVVERNGQTTCQTAPLAEIEAAKQHLYQLAMDGITLVTPDGRYTIKDLATQNAGTTNPLAAPLGSGSPNAAMLRNYQNVFADGASIKNCFVRPNEVYMGPANRTDLLVKAPSLPASSQGEVYTVVAKSVVVHADNYQQNLQNAVASGTTTLVPGPEDIVIGYLVVTGEPVAGTATYGPDIDVLRLRDVLPPVPPYLQPIQDGELRTAPGGPFRTRTVSYSGWGSQDFPLVSTDPTDPSSENFKAFIESPEGKRLEKLYYAPHGGVEVLMPAAIRTMAIDGRKFDPTDPARARMLVNSAEEWAVYNNSVMLWGNTTTARTTGPGEPTGDPRSTAYKQPAAQYKGHYVSYPISRSAGQQVFAENHDFQIVSKGVDHPFHIHQNPFWVTRIEIPDEQGTLHNILNEPCWMDALWIPRHRGRAVFRARFPDYVGTYVHHCHILMHEDNGMMTVVEVTPFEEDANFESKTQVASTGMSAQAVTAIYPRLTPEAAYVASSRFVDPNDATGQAYPGFDVVPPRLPS